MGQKVRTHLRCLRRDEARRAESGFSLIETIIALGVLAVVAAGVLPLGIIATKSTHSIQECQPDLVIDVIRTLVGDIRSGYTVA